MKHQLNIKHHTLGQLLFCTAMSLLFVTILSFCILSSAYSYASNSETSNVSVIVNSACSITTGGGNYARVVSPGTAEEITGNGINVTCNDNNGYSIYAVGYSTNGLDTTNNNNTKMLAISSSNYIPTGTSSSGSEYGSYWAMKAAGSSSLSPSTAPTIDNSFSTYQQIPATPTQVSHYTGTTLGSTSNSVTTPTYKVYVATAQPASTYIGKVKYTLVHPNDVPVANYMQNWNGCSTMAIGSETFLVDSRDEKVYNVVKFNDGKCWMTTNLDLAGGTALSSTDTDVSSDYIANFTTSNNLTKDDVNNKIILPESSTTGFDTNNYSYVYNSGNPTNNCHNNTPCYSYYSWDAATLGSGRSITASNVDAPYSICPAGWHLPNTRTGTDSTSDFRNLMIVLGGVNTIETYDNNTTPTGAEMYNRITSAPLHFLLAGYYSASTFNNGGGYGYYWSTTSISGTNTRSLSFGSSYVYSAFYGSRKGGSSVRCLTQ